MSAVYLLTIIIVTTAEHFTFGRWWAKNEIARRTMGHATILAISALFSAFDFMDLLTIVYMTIATGLAGMVIAGLSIYETEQQKRQKIAKLLEQYEHEQSTE